MDLLRRRMAAWALAFAALLMLSGCGERWTGEGPPAETGEEEENGEEGNGEEGNGGEEEGEEDLLEGPIDDEDDEDGEEEG